VNNIIKKIGLATSLCALAMASLTLIIVISRYGFNWSAIALQESVMYLHALLFLGAIPWALQTDHHVRVDIIYRAKGKSYKAWVNALGFILFLMPTCVFIIYQSANFALESWAILEDSPHANGLPLIYILKTLIPCSFSLLLIQGIALFARDIKTLVIKHG